jgi:membrane protein
MDAKAVFALLKDTFTEWGEDNAANLGAAVAYYTVFSLAPLLVIVIAIAGLVFGRQAVEGQVVGQVGGLVGTSGGQFIQTMVANASKPSAGIIATVVGVVTLVIGASGLFVALQASLNQVWEIAPKPRGVVATIKDRLLSFGMVVVIAFLLLVSLVISTALVALGKLLGGALPLPPVVLEAINFLISFVIIGFLFGLLFKELPDAEVSWHDVAIGGAFTALLFTIGKVALGIYLGLSGTASTYGAAGALVLILLWVYYSAQIVFFGAEFTQIYANRYGSKIRPAPDATSIADHLHAKDLQPQTEHTDRQPGQRVGEEKTRERRPAPAAPHGARAATPRVATVEQPSGGRRSPLAVGVALLIGLFLAVVEVIRKHETGTGAGSRSG